MTDRERILCALTGKRPDRIAFVPRLEFWLRGRRHTHTLPEGFEDLTLPQLIEKLDVGWYASIPDFTDRGDSGGIPDRTLGILRSKATPFEVILGGEVERIITEVNGETVVVYHTPLGSIRTAHKFTEEMRECGVSTSYITDHAIKKPEDIEIVGYIFENMKVIPALDGLIDLQKQVGDKGVVVAMTSGAACPMQHIMRTLMTLENFFYFWMDQPEKFHRLAEQMDGYYQGIKEIAANSPAEIVMLGGNYDASMTYPDFFGEHILPPLREYARKLHRRGKFLMTHTDGENDGLLPLYLEAEFDLADSICPLPMTRNTLDEIREVLGQKVTIWGGIPSVLLCKHSSSWENFTNYVDELLEKYGHESHFVLGVSDMVTADAEFDRLQYIAQKVKELTIPS
jgi:uroporphyrinogen-III decarboxylase